MCAQIFSSPNSGQKMYLIRHKKLSILAFTVGIALEDWLWTKESPCCFSTISQHYHLFPWSYLNFSYLYWLVTWRVRHFSPIFCIWPVWNVFIWTASNEWVKPMAVTFVVSEEAHRTSELDINISWQLWLIKCLTSQIFCSWCKMNTRTLLTKAKDRTHPQELQMRWKYLSFHDCLLPFLSFLSLPHPPRTPVLLAHLVKIPGKRHQ